RILSAPETDGVSAAAFVQYVAERDGERARDCLSAISAKLGALSDASVAQLKSALKPVLERLLAREKDTPLNLSAQLLAARLGLAQIDPALIRARFTSASQPEDSRLQALDALIAFRDPALLSTLPQVFSTDAPQFIRRAFAALG